MKSYQYPIIVLHQGNQDYLKTCLAQAHFSNPDARIILIGDESNKDCLPFVEHYDFNDYFSTAKDLEKVYRHLSINPYQFELFAIQKLFVLNEFLKKNPIEQFLYIDSDVLIYSDFSKENEYMEHLQSYDLTISDVSGHSIFYQNKEIVDKFCNFILKKYQDEEFMAEIENLYNTQSTYNGWRFDSPLSDMTWLFWFSKEKDVKCFNTSVLINNSLINHNLYDGNHSAINKMTNILFIDKKPHALPLNANSLVRFHTLHFQGWKKRLMSKYATFDKDKSWHQVEFDFDDLIEIFEIKTPKTKKIVDFNLGKRRFTVCKTKVETKEN